MRTAVDVQCGAEKSVYQEEVGDITFWNQSIFKMKPIELLSNSHVGEKQSQNNKLTLLLIVDSEYSRKELYIIWKVKYSVTSSVHNESAAN